MVFFSEEFRFFSITFLLLLSLFLHSNLTLTSVKKFFINCHNKLWKKTFSALSLIEITIVLVILGLMTGAILKGQAMIEQARINKTAKNIEEYRSAIGCFFERYNFLPGDFPDASRHFGEHIGNGDGNGSVGGTPLEKDNDSSLVWQHLYSAKMIQCPSYQDANGLTFPKTPFGGGFALQENPTPNLEGLWLILGNLKSHGQHSGLFTPSQAQGILEKLGNTDPQNGDIQVGEGSGEPSGSCIQNGKLNMTNKKRSCVVYARIDL